MMVQFPCRCGKSFDVDTTLAGQDVPCPHCGADSRMPSNMSVLQSEKLKCVGKEQSAETWKRNLTIATAVIFCTGMAMFAFARTSTGGGIRGERNRARKAQEDLKRHSEGLEDARRDRVVREAMRDSEYEPVFENEP